MIVYDLMTGGDKEKINQLPGVRKKKQDTVKPQDSSNVKGFLDFYGDCDLDYKVK